MAGEGMGCRLLIPNTTPTQYFWTDGRGQGRPNIHPDASTPLRGGGWGFSCSFFVEDGEGKVALVRGSVSR